MEDSNNACVSIFILVFHVPIVDYIGIRFICKMNVFLLLISLASLFVFGIVWMRIKKPMVPYLTYSIKYRWYDLGVNAIGYWIYLFGAGVILEKLVKMPHVETHFIVFFTRIISFAICSIYLKYTFQRVVHPGPFIIPSTLNVLATLSQSQSVLYINVPEFAVAKMLRLIVISSYASKNKKEKFAWMLVCIVGSYFMFMYEYSNIVWKYENIIGIIWLLVFILSDSFTCIAQQEIFDKFKVNSMTMMYYINLYIILLVLPQIITDPASFIKFISILMNNSLYVLDFILLAVMLLFAQFFALRLIRQFGSLAFIMVCIGRSMLTITLIKHVSHGLDIETIYQLLLFIILVFVALHLRLKHKEKKNGPIALL